MILPPGHEGKTLERVFFKDPLYDQWLYEEGIHRQEHFGEEERGRFEELYQRATHLGGHCSRCRERPVLRMALSTSYKTGELLAVGFYCDECESQGGTPTGYYRPSFIVEAYTVEPREQQMIINGIRRHYLGDSNLTHRRMEAFFNEFANFSNSVSQQCRIRVKQIGLC